MCKPSQTAKWCSGAPSGAVVRAVSTGNSFGVVCHGTDTGGDPEPLPYCPNVAVLYTKLQPGTNCIKICLPGKLILSKRKGLWEVLFS